jgi:hypothetical protein
MRLTLAFTLLAILLLCSCDGDKTAQAVFTPTNDIDGKKECNPVQGNLVGDRVDQVLKSGVITAIEKQITDANTEKKELKPVKVRIFLVSLEELTKEVEGDGRKDLDPKSLFDKYDAYTYAPNTDKTGTVKIKIFCKSSIQSDIAENDDKHGFDRKLVHELVHAKLIAMGDVGEKPPFTEVDVKDDPPPEKHKEDHNGKFSKEVDDLMKNLPK